jgi:hypothetical protein
VTQPELHFSVVLLDAGELLGEVDGPLDEVSQVTEEVFEMTMVELLELWVGYGDVHELVVFLVKVPVVGVVALLVVVGRVSLEVVLRSDIVFLVVVEDDNQVVDEEGGTFELVTKVDDVAEEDETVVGQEVTLVVGVEVTLTVEDVCETLVVGDEVTYTVDEVCEVFEVCEELSVTVDPVVDDTVFVFVSVFLIVLVPGKGVVDDVFVLTSVVVLPLCLTQPITPLSAAALLASFLR